MLIGIDGNEANVKKRVGVGEYGFQVLKHLKTQNSKLKTQSHNLKFKIYLKRQPLESFPEETEGWKYKVFGPKKFWTQIALPLNLCLGRPRPDVFFSPTHYAPRFCPIPSVISIMDLSFFKFPEMFKKKDLVQLKSWTAYSAKKAVKILTISQASKNDIIRYYRVPKERIVVIYPGKRKIESGKGKMGVKEVRKKYGIEGDYILYVGTLQPRKNLSRLIEAFKTVCANYSNLKRINSNKFDKNSGNSDIYLVIAGKKGWMYDEIFQKVKELNLEKNVIFTGYVPDEDLPVLYKGAKCFVLASLYEGFGIPVLEAMSFGCPVVISNVSSLPEIGGKAAVYVDPYDVKDIAEKIKLIIENGKLKKEMREKGLEQAKKFSWEKCARETFKVLKEAAKLNV